MDLDSPIMEILMVVSFRTKISVISVPSCPLIGVERGNKSSSVALIIVSTWELNNSEKGIYPTKL